MREGVGNTLGGVARPRVGMGHLDASPLVNVLITGITGMVGSTVAASLYSRQPVGGVTPPPVRIFGMARFQSDATILRTMIPEEAVKVLRGDLEDSSSVIAAVQISRPSVVFHFGAHGHDGMSWGTPSLTLRTNVVGTFNLLDALRISNLTSTRVIMASSASQYGAGAPVGSRSDERTNQLPLTPFGVSKAAMELVGRQFGARFGMPIVYARLFPQVGIGQNEELPIQRFCRQVAYAEAGLHPRVLNVGNLSLEHDYSDMEDTAVALAHLGFVGRATEAYNLASGTSQRMADLLRLILEDAKVDMDIVVEPGLVGPSEETALVGDNTKVRELLKWQPRVDLSRAISRVLQHWRHKIGHLPQAQPQQQSPEERPYPLRRQHGQQHWQKPQNGRLPVINECTSTDGPVFPDRSGQLPSPKTISIALTTRNDDYGGGLVRRSTLSIQAMLRVSDEVVLLDLNSLKEPFITLLPEHVRNHKRMKSVVVTPAMCREIRKGDCGDRYFETLARNLAIGAATGDVIVSSNVDIVPPGRPVLARLMEEMTDWRIVFTLPRMKLDAPPDAAEVTPLKGSAKHAGGSLYGRSVCLRMLASKGLPLDDKKAFGKISLIINCGDFQMARRELWSRARFAQEYEGRMNADTMVQASWINQGVVIYEPPKVFIHHLSHERPGGQVKRMWNHSRKTYWNTFPHFAVRYVHGKPQLVNLRAPPEIPYLPNGTTRWTSDS